MKTPQEVVADPARALALAVIAEALRDPTRQGRRWIRRNEWARFWATEAGLEHADLVAEADRRDGYRSRVA